MQPARYSISLGSRLPLLQTVGVSTADDDGCSRESQQWETMLWHIYFGMSGICVTSTSRNCTGDLMGWTERRSVNN